MTTLTGPPKPGEDAALHRAAKMDAAFTRFAWTAVFTLLLTDGGALLAHHAWGVSIPVVPVWLVFWGFIEAVVHTIKRAAHAWYGVATKAVQPRVTFTMADAIELGKGTDLFKGIKDA